jgi:hypothetical protein
MGKSLVSRRNFIRGSSSAGLMLAGSALGAEPYHSEPTGPMPEADDTPHDAAAPGVSGQGNMRFSVLYTSTHLPAKAQAVLVKAHGGFAVDRRPGQGETYFALRGVGILQISSDLKTIRILKTAESMRNVNLHETTIWYGPEGGSPYLAFPADDAGKVFTTALDGTLVSTLNIPTADDEFEQPQIGEYFLGGGNFAPTGVTYLDGLYYITTGYCALDFVLTARISARDASQVLWNDLAFGGKGDEPGQFRTAHAVTLQPGRRQLEITDREHGEIKRFSRYGHYLSSLKMPMGSRPCSIDYEAGYAVVPTLDGPEAKKGAPIYIFQNNRLVSTIFPKADLGLTNFQHNHKAVIRRIVDRFYIIVQAWNPGDFAILEQVTTT